MKRILIFRSSYEGDQNKEAGLLDIMGDALRQGQLGRGPGSWLQGRFVSAQPAGLAYSRTEELAFWRGGATGTLSSVAAEWQHKGVEEKRKGGVFDYVWNRDFAKRMNV
ncbi:hypothetical protein TNCV_751801 [Trichonephila clavipes]|uniref:Uncharacterized protein n=1 Tax=Trichonephila clavipes TaxID=2585209 RepID=A0A8X7BI50_TRICX|nr:hypothetical protein TNCV_751801 [Trichonephila clavipes]